MAADAADFFFSGHLSYGERRRRAALRDGLAHGSRIAPHDPLPGKPVALCFSANGNLPIDRVAVYYTTNQEEPQGVRGLSSTSMVVLAEPGETFYDASMDMPVRRWYAEIPAQPDGTLVRYRADAWSTSDPGVRWLADNVEPVSAPPEHGRIFAFGVDRFQPPRWLDDAVLYQIFVDRFNTGAGEPPLRDPGSIAAPFGGTLRGVLEKLDYVQALGCNCIWLTPVCESPTYHGYNPSDYYQVAARLGTNETLKELIAEAHRRGMRMVLDFVANHTSNEHWLFREALANPASTAGRFYSIGPEWPEGYACYAHVRGMPELATEHAEVQRYLISAALHWLDDFGADGLRLDYVPGPPHAFWAAFQRGVKQRFPDALTLGEITAPLSEIATYAGRMDAFMDFSLAEVMRNVFARRTVPLASLLDYLDARVEELPPEMSRATLLDNHDMHRFLWLADGDTRRLKLGAVCQMTLEGAPIVYYGTEVGVSQHEDAGRENAYARAAMIWDDRQDTDLLAFYRRVIALRHAHPALRRGRRRRLDVTVTAGAEHGGAEDSTQVGAYVRELDGDALVVVLNNSEHPMTVQVSLDGVPHRAGAEQPSRDLRNLLAPRVDDSVAVTDAAVRLELPPLEAAVLG